MGLKLLVKNILKELEYLLKLKLSCDVVINTINNTHEYNTGKYGK